MRRFLSYFFICLFLYLFISSSASPVGAVCNSVKDAYGCGTCTCATGYTGSCVCVNPNGNICAADYSGCVTPPSPTPECGGCAPPSWQEQTNWCSAQSSCTTGQCFAVCNYDSCAWACTGDSSSCTQDLCTGWGAWTCNTTENVETRYCTSPSNCTGVAQARTPCYVDLSGTPYPTSTPTPPPGSTPTPTSGPLSCPSNFNVSCDYTGTQATISWDALSGASGYVLRVNKSPYTDWASAEDMFLEPVNPSQTITTAPNANYMYDVQGKKPGETYPYGGARCPYAVFNCPLSGRIQGMRQGDCTGDAVVTVSGVGSYNLLKVPPASYPSNIYSTGDTLPFGNTYTVSSTVPSGCLVSYSPLSNQITPHSPYTQGSTVNVTVPTPAAGYYTGYVDLYWKYDALSQPVGVCGTFNSANATTPITWTWDYGFGLQAKDNPFGLPGAWYYNAAATSPLTLTGTAPGKEVCARTTNQAFTSFSSESCLTCPLPANQQAVISGTLRQKSGTGCNPAGFDVGSLSLTTPDTCVKLLSPCTFSPDQNNATSYSCTVVWDNQACVAEGRQPALIQTATLHATAGGVDAGQFSDASCSLSGSQLTITAGGNQTKDIVFPIANENWVKLKNASFNASSTVSNSIPPFITAFDSDDDASQKYLIMNSALSTAGVALGVSSNAYSLPNWNDSSYAAASSVDPASFLSYVKSRKEFTKITALDQITANGIYVWDGAVDFPPITDSTVIPDKKFVLISTVKTIAIQRTVFEPLASVAIIANNITFGDTAQRAKGIFIGQTVNTGTNTNLGLKITGNLIAQTFNNGRAWSNTSRPSIFVVFDPNQYLDLLPYLSTANYQWRQIQ